MSEKNIKKKGIQVFEFVTTTESSAYAEWRAKKAMIKCMQCGKPATLSYCDVPIGNVTYHHICDIYPECYDDSEIYSDLNIRSCNLL
jgi:hypothetical protein